MSPQEQSFPNHTPSLEEVNAAYAEIVHHNRRNTGLAPMFRSLFSAIAEQGGLETGNATEQPDDIIDISTDMDSRLEQSVVEGDMSGELQEMFHGETFSRIGVKLAPLGSHLTKPSGERATSEALEPTIVNTELYKDFLATVSPEEVEPTTKQLLPAILGNLRLMIGMSFDSSLRSEVPPEYHPAITEYGEHALRTFLAIEPEYRRLGLDAETLSQKFADKPAGTGYLYLGKGASQEQRDEQAAHEAYNEAHKIINTCETLESYVTYWGRDLLPEYIAGWQYLATPEKQGFGPAQWHYDGGQHYWREAFDFLNQLEGSPRTSEFGEEVRQNLILSLDMALKEINESDKDGPLYFAGQRDDLQNIRNMLTGQTFDALRLEEYTEKPNYGL